MQTTVTFQGFIDPIKEYKSLHNQECSLNRNQIQKGLESFVHVSQEQKL